jgi:hypothetical protein
MELSNLLSKTASIEVAYNGFIFLMQVFTELLTPAYRTKMMLLALQAHDEGDADGAAAAQAKDESAQILADLIESWTDEHGEAIVLHGEAFEPTYENLTKLSFPMIARLTTEITNYLGELASPKSASN